MKLKSVSAMSVPARTRPGITARRRMASLRVGRQRRRLRRSETPGTENAASIMRLPVGPDAAQERRGEPQMLSVRGGESPVAGPEPRMTEIM